MLFVLFKLCTKSVAILSLAKARKSFCFINPLKSFLNYFGIVNPKNFVHLLKSSTCTGFYSFVLILNIRAFMIPIILIVLLITCSWNASLSLSVICGSTRLLACTTYYKEGRPPCGTLFVTLPPPPGFMLMTGPSSKPGS